MGIVRYFLALSVMIAHFNAVTGGNIWFPVSSGDGVGGFFGMSGFLIYGSFLKRERLKPYVVSRGVRLLPAYFSTVIFFSLLLVLFSSLPPAEYFLSAHFWRYEVCNLAFLNFLEPTLPGVFTTNNFDVVNGSLWTMKVEWCLYLSVPVVVYVIRKLKMESTLMFVIIYVLSVVWRLVFLNIYIKTGNEGYIILARQFGGQMMFFYTGVLIYFYFDLFMRYRYWVLALSLAVVIIAEPGTLFHTALRPAAITSLVIWFSMVGRWGTWCGKHDNVSYNMYLIHFPVIQILAYESLPMITGTAWTFVIYLLVVVILSVLLNRFIERPIQRRYRRQSG